MRRVALTCLSPQLRAAILAGGIDPGQDAELPAERMATMERIMSQLLKKGDAEVNLAYHNETHTRAVLENLTILQNQEFTLTSMEQQTARMAAWGHDILHSHPWKNKIRIR